MLRHAEDGLFRPVGHQFREVLGPDCWVVLSDVELLLFGPMPGHGRKIGMASIPSNA
jgi:hypothetical protein